MDLIEKSAEAKDKKSIFKLCDEIRDEELPLLGVRLEDRVNEASIWKLVDKEILM